MSEEFWSMAVKTAIYGFVAFYIAWRVAKPLMKALLDGRVKKLTASKEGGLSLEMDEVQLVKKHSNDRYHRDERIRAEDHQLQLEARRATFKQRNFILRTIDKDSLCGNALWALSSNFLNQLLEAVFENNFKENLSSCKIEAYRAEKVEAIKEEYLDFLLMTSGQSCANEANPSKYPEWAVVEPTVKELVRHWTLAIATVVVAACYRKIEIYNECREKYLEDDDKEELALVDSCIEKNRKYIEGIRGGTDVTQGT